LVATQVRVPRSISGSGEVESDMRFCAARDGTDIGSSGRDFVVLSHCTPPGESISARASAFVIQPMAQAIGS
jgi:hypothetical protein